MAFAVRLRCSLQPCRLGLRTSASQPTPAASGVAPSKDGMETTSSTTSTASKPPVISETSTAAPPGGRAAGMAKPKTFEVAHLGNMSGKAPEKFIPVSRRLLMRRLIEDKALLSESQSVKFKQFALALNRSVSTQMVDLLDDMKHLYDPLDPDKDTISQHRLSRSEQLDHEFWLLQQLARVLEKANFRRLPQHLVSEELREHDTNEGVRVSVNINSYDTLQIWTRGRGPAGRRESSGSMVVRAAYWLGDAVKQRFFPPPAGSGEAFKRVVLLARPHNSNKLILKVFRDINCRRLEILLPDGRIVMSKMDRYMLLTGISSGIITLSVKAIAFLLDMQLNYAWIGALLVGITGFRAWLAFNNKRNAYLAQLTQTLYFHNVANNRAVLAQLSDRAADEQFKEALLLYTFVLSSQRDDSRLPSSKPEVQRCIEQWLSSQFKLPADSFQFDMSDAMSSLQRLGLITERSRDSRLMTSEVAEAILLLQSHALSVASPSSSEVMEATDGEIDDINAEPSASAARAGARKSPLAADFGGTAAERL